MVESPARREKGKCPALADGDHKIHLFAVLHGAGSVENAAGGPEECENKRRAAY